MLTTLQGLIGKEVELLIGGHFIQGTITSVDPVNKLFVFDDNPDAWTISVNAVEMVREL